MAVGAGPLLSASGNLSPPAYAGTIALDSHVLMPHRLMPTPARNPFIQFAYQFSSTMRLGNNAVLCAACPSLSLFQFSAVRSILGRMKKALSIALAAMMVAVQLVNDKRGRRLEPAN